MRQPPQNFSPYFNRAGLKDKAAIIDRMAEDLRDTAAANGSAVTENDLEQLGWTPQQITHHGREATRRAYARAARA